MHQASNWVIPKDFFWAPNEPLPFLLIFEKIYPGHSYSKPPICYLWVINSSKNYVMWEFNFFALFTG